MNQRILVHLILTFEIILGFNPEPTYLVLNHFDRDLPTAEQALIDNFGNSTFEFDPSIHHMFEDIATMRIPLPAIWLLSKN